MATNSELLAQARTARHDLIMGNKPRVFVDQNGERVEFTATNLDRLDKYIRELEALVNPLTARANRPRPIGFTF